MFIEQQETAKSDKKLTDSRRKLLKSIAAGSTAVIAGKTVPDAWTRPVVDSVMLPAHAETTDEHTRIRIAAASTESRFFRGCGEQVAIENAEGNLTASCYGDDDCLQGRRPN